MPALNGSHKDSGDVLSIVALAQEAETAKRSLDDATKTFEAAKACVDLARIRFKDAVKALISHVNPGKKIPPKVSDTEPPPRKMGVSSEAILKFIDDAGSATIDELVAETRLTPAGVNSQLYSLKGKGMVEKLSNGEWGFTLAEQSRRRSEANHA